jgi:spermidine synthase
MAKVKMVCPISKGYCVECAIYRGRHFYLCFSKEYQGVTLGTEQINELKAQYKSKDNKSHDKKFGMPADIQESSRWIHNVEDLTE